MNATVCTRTEEEVLAYVCGELGEEDEQSLAEHLAECGGCRDQAVEFRSLQDVLADCCAREIVRWHSFATPFGRMYLAATDRGLARVSWRQPDEGAFVRWLERRFSGRPVVQDPAALEAAEEQLREYFAGERDRFDLPVDLSALGDFDRSVLEAARGISFGQVVPYAELARRIGKPRAYRAVGNALNRNPVAIVVPCHRVVRSDGTLGGYGGGVEYKERLLEIEGREDLLERAS
jgi:methylated-DNA-[protein]-cysteine S-methyltransferase